MKRSFVNEMSKYKRDVNVMTKEDAENWSQYQLLRRLAERYPDDDLFQMFDSLRYNDPNLYASIQMAFINLQNEGELEIEVKQFNPGDYYYNYTDDFGPRELVIRPANTRHQTGNWYFIQVIERRIREEIVDIKPKRYTEDGYPDDMCCYAESRVLVWDMTNDPELMLSRKMINNLNAYAYGWYKMDYSREEDYCGKFDIDGLNEWREISPEEEASGLFEIETLEDDQDTGVGYLIYKSKDGHKRWKAIG